MKEKIKTIKGLKKKYPSLWEEIVEQFSSSNKKIKNFELDYFEKDVDNNTFYLSMSSGICEELVTFDMGGEILDDEMSINYSSWSKSSSDDVYNKDEMVSYDDEKEESDY